MLERTSVTTGSLTYQTLGENIHFVRFEEASRQTVITLINLLERLYAQSGASDDLYLLVDSSAVSLPMTTAIREGIDLEKRHPNHPTVHVALLQRHPLAKMLDTMLRPLRFKNHIRLFDATEREQAIDWLIAKQNKPSETWAIG
ncbi:MAG: STAS/SEC14 domain-containing protein [Anaerolineae bacterium]|nr:STAS/SEC14 domain-containing protein [Anaerolineae bacterium]